MKTVLTYAANGLFTASASYPDSDAPAPGPNQVLVDGGINPTRFYYDHETKEVKPLAERPSELHTFDTVTKQWVLSTYDAWVMVRSKRDLYLRGTDWRVTKATESGVPMDPAWAAYRQALRDITNQTDPHNIVWPTPPA